MKKNILIIFLIIISKISLSQSITYNKLISPYGNNFLTPFAACKIISNNSNYIVSSGGFDTINNNYQCINLYNFDSLGNASKIISFSRDGYNYYQANSFIKTQDGGYCLAGYIDSTDTSEDLTHFIIKFNSNLDTLWTKYIPPQDTIFEAYRNFCETSDKSLVFVGDRYANPYNTNIIIKKTDSLGNQLWKKYIPIAYLGGGYNVLETLDKGFLINGYNNSFTYGQGDCILIKTDSLGNQQWTKYMDINNNQHDGGGAMALTNDGNILYAYGYATYTYPFNENYSARLNISKLKPNGTIIWNRMYDTIRMNLHANKIQVLPNNDFIVMGSHSERDSANFFPSYLFKFKTNGDSLWRRTYYLSDRFGDLNLLADNVLNADGSITACGWLTGDTLVPSQQIWILKTDSTGYAPGPQNYVGIIDLPYLQVGYGGIKVFPNPATIQTTITYTQLTKESQLQVYNILGQLVYEEKLSKGSNQCIINTTGFKPGLYKVVVGERSETLIIN